MSTEKTNDAWTEYRVPWVRETSTPFVYEVESRSEFLHHTVDLTQRGGHGACTCMYFQKVANANFRRHGQFIPYAPKRFGVSECAHICAAREHAWVHTFIKMLDQLKNGIPPV